MNPFRCFVLAVWLLLGVASIGAAPKQAALRVQHAPAAPRAGDTVVITVESVVPLSSAILEYQVVEPGNYIALGDTVYSTRWVSIPLERNPASSQFHAVIPPPVQKHRNLVRYRVRATSADSGPMQSPEPSDTQPNHAYFVYDGIPGWEAAIDPTSWDPRKSKAVQFPPEVMGQVQSYFLVARRKDVENATWREQSQGKEYRYTGTFVAEGKVYDHVPFRARGGVWRYAMGKNMWKFNFNKGHHLEAKDDYGQRYRTKWGKLNLRACIQQGDYGRRGEQGMYEAVGFRLFNLAGVDAPRTHWISLRIVSEKEENPSDQYRGDFWGLYLAIENEDGDFLEEHNLPDGSIYKMMFGQGEASYQAKRKEGNRADLQEFLGSMYRTRSEAWWRNNVDLPRYYSYRSIIEAIHHYDVGDGKNYTFYFNPETAKWCVIPWDIDLTWGDHMYGSGRDPFYSPVMSQPALRTEYHNRLREIRDLLFNPEQAGRLIDECAAIISDPNGLSIVDADRMKWDYHPIMASGASMSQKAGKGLFYQAARSRNFAGMVAQMKEYVIRRAGYIDRSLLGNKGTPETPKIAYTGPVGYPLNNLSFKTSPYDGLAPFAAMQWRIARVDRSAPPGRTKRPGHYEINAQWDSGELTVFKDEIVIPSAGLGPGASYRVRCRMKDKDGQWSHWSEPMEITTAQTR